MKGNYQEVKKNEKLTDGHRTPDEGLKNDDEQRVITIVHLSLRLRSIKRNNMRFSYYYYYIVPDKSATLSRNDFLSRVLLVFRAVEIYLLFSSLSSSSSSSLLVPESESVSLSKIKCGTGCKRCSFS